MALSAIIALLHAHCVPKPLTIAYQGKLESDSKMSGSTSVAEMSLDADLELTSERIDS